MRTAARKPGTVDDREDLSGQRERERKKEREREEGGRARIDSTPSPGKVLSRLTDAR